MNRRSAWGIVATIFAWVLSGMAESVYLVQISDIRKRDAWEVMTREEIEKLRKDIQEEARVFPAALEAAKKEWKADRRYRRTRFPGDHLAPREITRQTPFADREIANKKKLAKEGRQGEQTVEEGTKGKNSTESAEALRRRMLMDAKRESKKSFRESAEALRQQNIDKAAEKVHAHLTEMLKRDPPLDGF